MKHIIALLSFLFLMLPWVSRAGIHLEPYADIGGSYASAFSSRPLFISYSLGGKIAYQFSVFKTGVDLFWTSHNTGGSSSSLQHVEVYHDSQAPVKGFGQAKKSVSLQYSAVSANFQPFSIGAFAEVELPFIFDAYGGLFYTFGDKGGLNHQGFGAKAGFSYFSAFYLKFNLELRYAYYNCMDQSACSSGNFGILSALFSLSFPFPPDLFDFSADSAGNQESAVTDTVTGSAEEEVSM